MSNNIDLVVLVADVDAEISFRTLLCKRHHSLGIRQISFEIFRYSGRDSGVYQQAPEILRQYLNRAKFALVVLDREGSGQERKKTAQQIETDIENRLKQSGWMDSYGNSRCIAITLDPELEVWVWSRSPHVAEVIGLDQTTLQQVLERFPKGETGKPERPKEALEAALRQSRKPISPAIFRELAEKVSLQVSERAFDKFRTTMQTWFPSNEV